MAHSRYKSSLADIGFSVCQSGTHSSAPIHWSTNAKSMHSLTCVEAEEFALPLARNQGDEELSIFLEKEGLILAQEWGIVPQEEWQCRE